MPAHGSQAVPEPARRGFPKENARQAGLRVRSEGPLPGIRHGARGSAGTPATARGLRSFRSDSGLKAAGTWVAARPIDVLDHSPVSFDSVVVGQSPRMRTIF